LKTFLKTFRAFYKAKLKIPSWKIFSVWHASLSTFRTWLNSDPKLLQTVTRIQNGL